MIYKNIDRVSSVSSVLWCNTLYGCVTKHKSSSVPTYPSLELMGWCPGARCLLTKIQKKKLPAYIFFFLPLLLHWAEKCHTLCFLSLVNSTLDQVPLLGVLNKCLPNRNAMKLFSLNGPLLCLNHTSSLGRSKCKVVRTPSFPRARGSAMLPATRVT